MARNSVVYAFSSPLEAEPRIFLGRLALVYTLLLASSLCVAQTNPPLAGELAVDAAPPRPVGELALAQAIDFAVKNSPELKAYAWEAEGSRARIRQARLWANPELEYERENFGGTGQFAGSSGAEATLSLAQHLPLGGDAKHRRAIAKLESEQADWDYHAARLSTIASVTRRFIVAHAADKRLELARKELELARAIERIASSRVEAGDASAVELSRVVVPVVTAELNLAKAERRRNAAYKSLALSWGQRVASFDRLMGDFETVSTVPAPESLIQDIRDNPEVARWTIEISARIAQRRFAQAEAIPDLTARLGYREDNESGDEALVFGISLPLPLFDRNQGNIEAARLSESSARSRQRAAELRIERMLNDAYVELISAYDEAVALRQRALPAAEKAYEATRLAFLEGKLPFLDALDSQRTLFALQRRNIDALQTFHTRTAEIESLIGRSIDKKSDR